MPMGVLFVTEVNEDKGCPIFVGCCHNTEMLKRLLTVEKYNILETLMEEFLQKTYEYIDQVGKPIPGLVNFFLNKKSRNVDPDDTSTVNRSYSIGGTLSKVKKRNIRSSCTDISR